MSDDYTRDEAAGADRGNTRRTYTSLRYTLSVALSVGALIAAVIIWERVRLALACGGTLYLLYWAFFILFVFAIMRNALRSDDFGDDHVPVLAEADESASPIGDTRTTARGFPPMPTFFELGDEHSSPAEVRLKFGKLMAFYLVNITLYALYGFRMPDQKKLPSARAIETVVKQQLAKVEQLPHEKVEVHTDGLRLPWSRTLTIYLAYGDNLGQVQDSGQADHLRAGLPARLVAYFPILASRHVEIIIRDKLSWEMYF